MKRSEMVKELNLSLLRFDKLCGGSMKLEGIVDLILERAEELGMKAPEANIKARGGGCLCTMRESCVSCGGILNEWELE